MSKINNRLVTIAFLFLIAGSFFSFGLYHLAKFETVDEHFWKYDRVPKYWMDGILKHNAIKTYINDKPGITTAIISGAGLPFIQSPQEHRIRDSKITDNDNYTVYDSSQAERINFALRLPLLIINSLLLLYLFWIVNKLTHSNVLSFLVITFIGLSPILIGISQIINPDTFLWSCGFGALISYWVFLKENQKKYIILATLFTGLAILSKYTGTILFFIFPISLLVHFLFAEKKELEAPLFSTEVKKHIFWLIFILAGASIIYSLGMPAVFVKAKYFLRGTILSPAFKSLATPTGLFLLVMLLDAQLFKSKGISYILNFLKKYANVILKILSVTTFIFIIFLFINSWFGQNFIPLDNVRENAYYEKELNFPMFDNDSSLVKIFKKIAVEAYPLPFSISPVALFFISFLLLMIVIKKKIILEEYILIILLIIPIFLVGALMSGLLLNPRYMIMLYPLIFMLAAIGCYEFILLAQSFCKINKHYIIISMFGLIFVSGFISLWTIKPFYFNYMSDLLPKDQLITDSWGYGSYEAAQYLNGLPDAENIVIWADRSAICQFIKGRCIRDYKIDLSKTIPDFFVFTRRGQIRHQFIWENPNLAKKPSSEYYDETKTKNLWKLSIGGREDNFIRIVKSEEKQN